MSGLVPLVVLAVAALGFGRLRPGGRTAVGLVAGLLGVAAAAEAVHAGIEATPSGEPDFSGFLAIPAGLALLTFAVLTLRQSRKTSGSRARRYVRRGVAGIAGHLQLV